MVSSYLKILLLVHTLYLYTQTAMRTIKLPLLLLLIRLFILKYSLLQVLAQSLM